MTAKAQPTQYDPDKWRFTREPQANGDVVLRFENGAVGVLRAAVLDAEKLQRAAPELTRINHEIYDRLEREQKKGDKKHVQT